MNEFDAYAPPATDTGTQAHTPKESDATNEAIIKALERLEEHLRDPEKAQNDLDQAGSRFRRITVGLVVGAVFAGVIIKFVGDGLMLGRERKEISTLLWMTVCVGLWGVYHFIADLMFAPRTKVTAPLATLRHYFEAIRTQRMGHAWSLLCPTAREQTVPPPNLGPIAVSDESHDLVSPDGLAQYVKQFAHRPRSRFDTAQGSRTFHVQRATLLREDGDVAGVDVTVKFRHIPQWVETIPVVGFLGIVWLKSLILFALAMAIYGVSWLFASKTHAATFCKTLIRGSNGLWYIHSGDLMQDVAPIPIVEPKEPKKRGRKRG